MAGQIHILLQDLALRRLGKAEVHHLVHELVDDDEVVADGLFLEFLEVLDEHLYEPVQEQNDLRGICVSFGEGEDFAGQTEQVVSACSSSSM